MKDDPNFLAKYCALVVVIVEEAMGTVNGRRRRRYEIGWDG